MKCLRVLIALVFAFIAVQAVVASSYTAGRQMIEERINADIQKGLRQGNEPFFMGDEESKAGVLLVHGFTASPWEVRELGEYLSNEGLIVYGPLLEGHGTSADDLRKTKWQDWYKKVNESYNLMEQTVECVYVGGMSTGSSLALMLAAEHDTCGVIAIGTPVFFQDWKIRFAWLAKYVMPFTTRYLSPEVEPYYYEKRPTAAVAELFKMVGIMKDKLPDVDEPVIIIQSLEDKTIKPKSAEYILTNIGSNRKVFIWFERGEHVIIKADQKDEVFKLIGDFVKEE